MIALADLRKRLQAHILDGDPALCGDIETSAEIPATTRLRIYSDAYRLRLIEALQANYPCLAQLLGEDEFARLTQLYLNQNPSRHFSVRWFGHKLADFLQRFEDYASRPWLADLAAWEWNIAAAFDAPDAPALVFADLTTLAPEEWALLPLVLHPSVRRISLGTNAAAIAKAIGDATQLPEPASVGETLEWVIWRQDLAVRFRSLKEIEAIAIDATRAGATFGELCVTLAHHLNADEVPGRAALLLREWIEQQLLARPAKPNE